MSCKYCTEQKSIFYENIGAVLTEVFVTTDGILQFDQYIDDANTWDHVYGKRLQIVYCPMCGRRLGS